MEFSVGNALGTSFRVWFRNFVPFTLLSVIVHLPIIILWWSVIAGNFAGSPDDLTRNFAIAFGSGFLLQGLLISTVVYGVVMELNGKRASFMDCVVVGLKRFLPAVLVTILFILAIGVGLIVLIVPGVIIACVLWVSIPASVIEKPGIGGAFSRSATLTSGYRGQVFGLALLVWGGNMLVSKVLQNAYGGPNQVLS